MTVDRTSLDNVFGPDNIDKWADLQNAGNSGYIATRVTWAITLASKYVQSQLRTTAYNWVDVREDPLVEHAVALKAGILLYGNRAVNEAADPKQGSPMGEFRRAYDDFFKGLADESIVLGDDLQDPECRNYPGILKSEDLTIRDTDPLRTRPWPFYGV